MEVPSSVAHWVAAQLDAKRFRSADEALEFLIELDTMLKPESWMQPYIEAGLADAQAGRTVSAEEVEKQLSKHWQ